jgi:hypothetical protein
LFNSNNFTCWTNPAARSAQRAARSAQRRPRKNNKKKEIDIFDTIENANTPLIKNAYSLPTLPPSLSRAYCTFPTFLFVSGLLHLPSLPLCTFMFSFHLI